jgi:glycosyltransferase involved in cell wall biosynthesis
MSHPQLSIVIPAYNESARIEATLNRVMQCVEAEGWDAEVLVVDDGSQDDTTAIVEQWMRRYARLHLVKNHGNRGKGYSVRNGLLQAAGDIVMFTDADLSAPMEEANRLIAAIRAGADVAIVERDAAEVQGYAVRVQGIYATSGAADLPAADDRALGLRSRAVVHCAQAEVSGAGGSGNVGPRRTEPDELSEGRREDARGASGGPVQLPGGSLR